MTMETCKVAGWHAAAAILYQVFVAITTVLVPILTRHWNGNETGDVAAMKEWSDEYTFSHPWELMAEAAYRKYPNPHNPNVRSLDTLERRAAPGRLFSHRLFSTMWNIPKLVLSIVGTNSAMMIHEQSMCDLECKTLTICARNLSLSGLFTMDETLVYSVNPKDPNTTVLRQTAKISVFGVPLLGTVLENLMVSNYASTVAKGRLGVESIAEQVRTEQNQPI